MSNLKWFVQLKRIVLTIIILAVSVVGVLLVIDNPDRIEFSLLSIHSFTMPLGVLVMLSFFIGLLFSLLLSWFFSLRLKLKLKRTESALDNLKRPDNN